MARAASSCSSSSLTPVRTGSIQSTSWNLLQSTVYLLPIRPSAWRPAACPRRGPGGSPRPSACGIRGGDDALRDQTLRVKLAGRRLAADGLVHDRLRRGRLVGLVVPEPAIADQVDDDVLVELHAVVEREARRKHDRFRIVAVHVQDRRFDHLRDVAAVQRRARVARVAGREADLVVDDHVHRAAGVEAARLRHLQRLHDDALAGERGIAVQQHGHHLVATRHRRGAPGARAPSLRRPGSTISRCDGLNASATCTLPPACARRRRSPCDT